jgi:hypothetical protein
MGMTIDEYMAELNRKKEAPAEPQKPAETGDFWTDMRNRWEHLNAQEQYNQQLAESAQNPHSGDMLLGEFRPANARERKINRLIEIMNAAGQKNSAFTNSERIMSLPKEAREKARMKIEKDVSPNEFTPQITAANPSILDPIYGRNTTNYIMDNIRNEMSKDISGLGYDPKLGGSKHWWNINERLKNQTPEYLYHNTATENLPSISQKGILPASQASNKTNFGRVDEKTGSWMDTFPEQKDKVFFSTEKDVLKRLKGSDVETSNIRTKMSDEYKPDLHQHGSDEETWYQTKNPVPPQALEIETAPGQWEALLDYIRKGGK